MAARNHSLPPVNEQLDYMLIVGLFTDDEIDFVSNVLGFGGKLWVDRELLAATDLIDKLRGFFASKFLLITICLEIMVANNVSLQVEHTILELFPRVLIPTGSKPVQLNLGG